MKKNNRFLFIFSIIIVACVLLFPGEKGADDTVTEMRVFPSWSEHFSDLSEALESTEYVIEGKLVGTYTEQRGHIVFTRNKIEVVRVILGEVEQGEVIEVLQTGGRNEKVATIPPSECPLLDDSSSYLLLLDKSEMQEDYGQYYVVKGGYQGMARLSGKDITPLVEENHLFDDYNLDVIINMIKEGAF